MVSSVRAALFLFACLLGAAIADVKAVAGSLTTDRAGQAGSFSVIDIANDAPTRKLLVAKRCKNAEAGNLVKHTIKPTSGSTRSGRELQLKCAKGYKGAPIAACESGDWSTSGRCKKVECDNERDLPNALNKRGLVVAEYPDYGMTPYDDYHQLDCDRDTYASGVVRAKCTEKGWDITSSCKKETNTAERAPTCDQGELATAFDKKNLVVAEYPDTDVVQLGEAYNLDCDRDTYSSGVVKVKCTNDGWEIVSSCKKEAATCDNGELAAAFDKRNLVVAEYPDSGPSELGDNYSLVCDRDTYRSGMVKVECTNSGWDIISSCSK